MVSLDRPEVATAAVTVAVSVPGEADAAALADGGCRLLSHAAVLAAFGIAWASTCRAAGARRAVGSDRTAVNRAIRLVSWRRAAGGIQRSQDAGLVQASTTSFSHWLSSPWCDRTNAHRTTVAKHLMRGRLCTSDVST